MRAFSRDKHIEVGSVDRMPQHLMRVEVSHAPHVCLHNKNYQASDPGEAWPQNLKDASRLGSLKEEHLD